MKQLNRPIYLAIVSLMMLTGAVFAGDPTGVSATPSAAGGTVVNAAALPPEVRALLQKFQDARARFLADETALNGKLKNSTNDQRAQLLSAISDLRQRWLDQSKALREEIRDQIKNVARETSKKRSALEGKGVGSPPGHGGK